MGTKTAVLGSQRGSALGVVLILAFVMLATVAAMFEIGAQDASLAARNEDSVQAFFLADGGLSEGVQWLTAQSGPPGGTDLIEPLGSDPVAAGEGTYYVTIQPDAGNPFDLRKEYTITSTATVGNKTRTLVREATTQSFARYIYFTDLECMAGSGTPIWFVSADALNGPVHTNGHIHIMGDPYFGGMVTSSWGGPGDSDPSHSPTLVYYNDGHNYVETRRLNNAPYDEPTFDAGCRLGSTWIDFPAYLDEVEAMAQNGGIHLTGNYKVKLSRSVSGSRQYGYVSYKPYRGGSWTDVEISSFNGILFVDGNVKLDGILDGDLTVGAAKDVLIMDDVVYRDADPVLGPNEGCDDILGIVAEWNIRIKNNDANSDGCNIHAHMMALGTSFKADDYNVGGPRGTLTVHGGIVQEYRGPVGTGYLHGGQVVINNGYAKNYNYDPRFATDQPPGYLTTGAYELMAWHEVGCD